MLCRDASLVKHITNGRELRPLRCKCWGCERCAPERTRDLKGLCRRGAPNRFLTLTRRAKKGDDPHKAAQELAHAFLLLRNRIKKKYGLKKLAYIAVFERHKSGQPHLHIMLRCRYIPQKWLSEQMDDLLQSPIVDIKYVTDRGRVAAYVAKYIAKAPERFDGCKRYWRSQDYELPENKYVKPEPDDNIWWSVHTLRPAAIISMALNAGHRVDFLDGKWFIHGAFHVP